MASGRLGRSNPTADTLTTVYTAPAGYYSVVTLAILNYTDASTYYKVAVLESGQSTPTVADYIEYETVITSKNIIERTGIVIGDGQKIVVLCPTSSLLINVFGIETQL